jgi:hypothetical protein
MTWAVSAGQSLPTLLQPGAVVVGVGLAREDTREPGRMTLLLGA